MAILTISGAPASRFEEVAHECAQLLGFEFVTESRLSQWMTEEFGETPVPDRAWRSAAVSILARLAVEHHLVICLWGAESLFPSSLFTLRAGIVAPDARRIGNVMLDQRFDPRMQRPEAKTALARMDREAKHLHKVRLGRTRPQPDSFDVMLNSEHMDASQMAEIVQAAAAARGLREQAPAVRRCRGADPIRDSPEAGASRNRPPGPCALETRRVQSSQRGGFRQPGSTFTASSFGITNPAVSRYSGDKDFRLRDRGVHRPTSTCPSSTCTWKSRP